MAGNLLDNIRRGSYRGVEFDTFSIDKTQVKKYTEHQYANSNRRYIEERGVQEPDFSVTFSIFGDGDTYLDRRDAMRKALNTQGEGLLVLPLEGEFNVKCVNFSDSQNIIESLGRCDFTASFMVISENETSGNPITVKNTQITLLDRVKKLRETIASIVNTNVVISNAVGYAAMLDKASNLVSRMTSIASSATGSSPLSSLLRNFASNIPSFLGGNIAILGSAISRLFYTMENAFDVADTLLSSSEALFDYGDADVSVSPNTPRRIEQRKNAQVLNIAIQSNAVGVAADAFANVDFSNEEELRNAEEVIENQIEKILNSDAMDNIEIVGIDDLKYIMKQLQVDFSDVVSEKELTTPKIKTIDVNGDSIALLSYKYYDNLDYVDSLINLNGIQNPKTYTGKMRILTDVEQ